MKKTILIRSSIIFTLLFGVGIKCFAMTAYDMNGQTVPVDPTVYWKVETSKTPDKYGNYAVNPWICKFKTDYSGVNGVKIRLSYATKDNGWAYFIVKNTESVVVSSSNGGHDMDHVTNLFKQPLLNIVSEGCSKYLDGDVCKTGSERPMVYAECHLQ